MMDEHKEKMLTIFRLDSTHLYERVVGRKNEYLQIFALKRTREHFDRIFNSKYQSFKVNDLAVLAPQTIQSLEEFYQQVEEISWYLYKTQDMPNTIEEVLNRMLNRLKKLYQQLQFFL